MGMDIAIALDKELHFCEVGNRLAFEYLRISRDVLNDVMSETEIKTPSFSVEDGYRGSGPLTGDVRAQGVETLDQADLTVLLQFHPCGENQVAAAAFTGDEPSGIENCAYLLEGRRRTGLRFKEPIFDSAPA